MVSQSVQTPDLKPQVDANEVIEPEVIEPGSAAIEFVQASIQAHILKQDFPPTLEELAQFSGLSQSTVTSALIKLEEQGRLYASRFGWRPRWMVSPNPRQAILAFLHAYHRLFANAPTLREIVKVVYQSKTTVYYHLNRLEKQGWIRRARYRHRGIVLLQAHPLDATSNRDEALSTDEALSAREALPAIAPNSVFVSTLYAEAYPSTHASVGGR